MEWRLDDRCELRDDVFVRTCLNYCNIRSRARIRMFNMRAIRVLFASDHINSYHNAKLYNEHLSFVSNPGKQCLSLSASGALDHLTHTKRITVHFHHSRRRPTTVKPNNSHSKGFAFYTAKMRTYEDTFSGDKIYPGKVGFQSTVHLHNARFAFCR